jgi:hypothetical protein
MLAHRIRPAVQETAAAEREAAAQARAQGEADEIEVDR